MLTCPECGFVGDMAAFLTDAQALTFVAAFVGLPDAVRGQSLLYLGLWRPRKRAQAWSRRTAILREIGELVATGAAQAGHGTPLPCPPEMWSRAMETMLAQRASLNLPLTSHGYLIRVAYGLAEQAAADRERRREEQARTGAHAAPPEPAEEHWAIREIGKRMIRATRIALTSRGGVNNTPAMERLFAEIQQAVADGAAETHLREILARAREISGDQ
ncbi:MAG: hypothetical protein HQL56_08200 [Magnetococcales bacterium]|nr:hypothetical protein [Magnetococcales bacterium]